MIPCSGELVSATRYIDNILLEWIFETTVTARNYVLGYNARRSRPAILTAREPRPASHCDLEDKLMQSATLARVSSFEGEPETQIGRALFEELLWVHGMIRRDLATVQRLAADVASTMPAHEIAAEIKNLKRDGKLWQLKMGCLRYCRFVHSHHNLEDAAFFPSLRAVNPALNPVVDKLEDDHRKVSELLDAVEEGADILTKIDSDSVRRTVGDTLTVLGEHLLEHLDYEEFSVGPTLRRMHGIDGITR
jgi:hypothetical protein